jgi:limonene-1,2-epoxide hydrolase
MSQNTQLIEEFCSAWSRLDAAELADYFTEDGVYHNMPADPITGRAQVKAFIEAFLTGWTKTDWEILTLAECGDRVIAERIDRTMVGDKKVELPCVGVFEIRGGKIA